MTNKPKIGKHFISKLHVHLVFVTKYRRRVFTERVLFRLEEVFKEICSNLDSDLVEFNGESDHVHLLINYPPKVAVSKLVHSLKGSSSRLIHQSNYPEVRNKIWSKALWSASYFAGSCGGAPLTIIKKYIKQQKRP